MPLLPTAWRADARLVLPANPALYEGPRLPFYGACAFLALVTARGFVHLLAPDRGARAIATIDISAPAGANIVGLFGQWGAI